MRLVLVRHGQTPSNVLGLLDTQPPGPGLTDLGREQAEALLGTLANEPIAAVYASTATRAQQTAAPLAGRSGLEIQVRSGLREVPAGNWEMLGDENSVQGFLGVIGRWLQGSLDERTPGPAGESGREVLQRFDDVVAEVLASGVEAAALVAHGAINRFWASVRADNLDDEYGATHPLRNTGVVILDGDLASGWTARSWTGAGLGGAEPTGAGGAAATAADTTAATATAADTTAATNTATDASAANATAAGTHRGARAPDTPPRPAWPAGPADEDPFDEKIPVPGQP